MDGFTEVSVSCSLAAKEANRKLCLFGGGIEKALVQPHRPWGSCILDVALTSVSDKKQSWKQQRKGKVTGLIRGAQQL